MSFMELQLTWPFNPPTAFTDPTWDEHMLSGVSFADTPVPFGVALSPLGSPHPLPAGPAAGMAAPLLPSRPAVSAGGLLGHAAAWLLGVSVLCRVGQAAEWPTRGYQDRKSNKEGKKTGE